MATDKPTIFPQKNQPCSVLRVRDWTVHFENNRTRELKRLDWVPIPNKQDGDGYTSLLDHPNGAAHLGAWLAIIQIASKCDVRGTLSREGARPHDSRSLARISRVPQTVLDEAIPRLLDIGWLEELHAQVSADQQHTEMPQQGAVLPQDAAGFPQQGALEGKGMEGNGREENFARSSHSNGHTSPDSQVDPAEAKPAPVETVSEEHDPMKPSPVMNEDWFRFRETAESAGMDGSSVDWDEAWMKWRGLDFTQRLLAINGIKERVEAGAKDDPALVSLPQNYLKKRMWERRMRQHSQKQSGIAAAWSQVS